MVEYSPKRKLATIFAADVVGYSTMMADNEESTVRKLKGHREITDRFIARHEGRIFSTGGDSVFAEFGSAVEAVRCAMSIQDELRTLNSAKPDEATMQFRIGINVGDVIVDGDDLLGDGVNIAARLEGLAEPGGICLSGSAFEQVKNKLSVGFSDLGPQHVKNIPDPVSAYGITTSQVSVEPGIDSSADDAGSSTTVVAGERDTSGVRISPRFAMISVIVILLAAGGGFFLTQTGIVKTSSLPLNITTDDMRKSDISELITGMVFRGNRSVDGQAFTIHFKSDKTLEYSFARTGGLSGTTERITGKWFSEDFKFCMQVPRFARGDKICPRIVKEGAKLFATRRRDGSRLSWSISRLDN
jgi:class 3 adenylate cyclase